jgi:hypothetical protein
MTDRRIPEAHAITGTTAWVACKEQSRVVRVDLARGRTTASRRLGGPVIAVAVGYRSVWALDTLSTLYRLNPRTARVTKRIRIQAAAPYNIWIGAGSVLGRRGPGRARPSHLADEEQGRRTDPSWERPCGHGVLVRDRPRPARG